MPIDNLNPQQSSRSFASIQEKNLQHLIKVLGTKQSIDALTAIGKVDKETWGNIKDSVKELKDFVVGGGISTLKKEIRGIVKDEAMGIFSPIMNEFQPLIEEIYLAFEPIFPYIVNAITWIVTIVKPGVEWIAWIVQLIIDILSGNLEHITSAEFLALMSDFGFFGTQAMGGDTGFGGTRESPQTEDPTSGQPTQIPGVRPNIPEYEREY